MQVFIGAENLLDVDREMLKRRIEGAPGKQTVDPPAQLAAIAAWVGQAVDMIDTQAIDQPSLNQLEQLGMGRLEYHRALYAQTAQLVDVEETPPVDVVGGSAPAGQAVGLAFQQQVQAFEAAFGAAVEGEQCRLQVGALAHQAGQFGLHRQSRCQRVGCIVQCGEVLGQALQGRLGAQGKNPAIVNRADREAVLVMGHLQHAVLLVELQRNFAIFQRRAIVTAQKRQQ
ncbi:hypothetical protein D3C78_866250 [compost metagenome]